MFWTFFFIKFAGVRYVIKRIWHSLAPEIKFNKTRTLHNILSNPLAAFPQTIVETMDSGERGMNSDLHQSLERILTEPGIEPATFCPQVLYAAD